MSRRSIPTQTLAGFAGEACTRRFAETADALQKEAIS